MIAKLERTQSTAQYKEQTQNICLNMLMGIKYERPQLNSKVSALIFGHAQEKSVVRLTDPPAMTLAVDLGRKATNQTNKQNNSNRLIKTSNKYNDWLQQFSKTSTFLFFSTFKLKQSKLDVK